MLPFSLSAITEFAYYNYVFDGIIVFFTIVYFFAGFKRGILRTLWYLIFDIISLVAVYCIYKFAFPLFIDKIPVVGVNLIKTSGTAFLFTSLYRVLLEILIAAIAFLIIRFGIFKVILRVMNDHNYTHSKKKNFLGRIVAATLTAGLAFTLSSGAIVTTKRMTKDTLFANYESEMSETYVAQYGETYFLEIYYKMINTNSIADPHDILLGVATDGKYNLDDALYYREAIQDLYIAHDVDKYLNYIKANTNEGLIRFSSDLKIWAIMAEIDGNEVSLDKVVSPIAKRAVELGYKYTGDVKKLESVSTFKRAFTSETYANIELVLY